MQRLVTKNISIQSGLFCIKFVLKHYIDKICQGWLKHFGKYQLLLLRFRSFGYFSRYYTRLCSWLMFQVTYLSNEKFNLESFNLQANNSLLMYRYRYWKWNTIHCKALITMESATSATHHPSNKISNRLRRLRSHKGIAKSLHKDAVTAISTENNSEHFIGSDRDLWFRLRNWQRTSPTESGCYKHTMGRNKT